MQTTIKRTIKPAVAYDANSPALLAAIFSVNRSAKRYRDAASSCYSKQSYKFATLNKNIKDSLYRAKDAGIMHAYRLGLIKPEGMHGNLCVYRGDGYCFHSFLKPEGLQLNELKDAGEENIFVESKPRNKSDMRLCDAKATLDQLDTDEDGFVRSSAPRFPKPQYRNSWYDDDDDEYDWDDNDDDEYY